MILENRESKNERFHRVYFDIGTSNSNVFLLEENKILDKREKEVGSKDVAIENDKKMLKIEMKRIYREILDSNNLADEDIAEIYASGMVTSKFGFKEVPHIPVPVSLEKLGKSIYSYQDEVFGREINLIRGLKTFSDEQEINENNFSEINNLRGEETEIFGIISKCDINSFYVFLPGSHTHIVKVVDNEIKDLLSSFTGELFHVISEHTLLSPSIDLECENYDIKMLEKGFRHSGKLGMNRSLYLINTLQQFTEISKRKKTSYLEGIILGDLIRLFRNHWPQAENVMVVARPELGFAYKKLLESHDYKVLELNCEKDFSVEGFKMLINCLSQ